MKPLLFSLITIFTIACAQSPIKQVSNPYAEQLKQHWYDGKGELSSYVLQQARYGEMHEGTAVLIFVTEDFSTRTMTKADQSAPENLSVLKLNAMRKFNTGIYPYSMMNSTFFPFPEGANSLKVTSSSQEWCGHTFMEVVDQGDFKVENHSYFQSDALDDYKLKKALLEDDLWSRIRLNPENLPQGKMELIPSFFFLRLTHQPVKAYPCEIFLEKDALTTRYTVRYPELERELMITYENKLPFQITGWSETYPSGWGAQRKMLTTSATLIKSLRTDYWTKNSNADSVWRAELGLE